MRGRIHTRGKQKRADYILYHKPGIPLAVVEAKDNKHGVGDGMQQALEYAEMLDVPFVFLSNGDGFIFHDKTDASAKVETELSLDEFWNSPVAREQIEARAHLITGPWGAAS